jgi:RimJ/RimL family protein N-acetyltransferase
VHPDLHAIEAVDEDGRIVGMVGYDGWMPGAVCLHIAIEHPAALRRLLRPGFGVAFDPQPRGVGKVAALATVLSTNERSLRLVRHLGFREVYRGRDWSGPGVDFVVHEMRREECRFLPRARKAA